MSITEIVPLAGVVLDPAGGILRDYTRPEGKRPESYLKAYDRQTLIYDCVWRADLGLHILNAPAMLNLWEPFRDTLRKDGKPVANVRQSKTKRTDWITIPGPPGRLTVELGSKTYTIPTRLARNERFAGLNVLVAINRNNELTWVRDWAHFHVTRHGAEAVILLDNASDKYTPEEIAAMFDGISGLKAAIVYLAPYPFGSRAGTTRLFERASRFFQTGMLTIARDDAAAAARAVLSVDIDELVEGPEGKSVFDATVRHPLGMLTLKGYWGYPESPANVPCGQVDHRWRAKDKKQCNRKWCVVPTGPLGRNYPWHQHQLGGVFQNLFTEQLRFHHLHCRGTTTGWKHGRTDFPPELWRDPALDALMERYLPKPV